MGNALALDEMAELYGSFFMARSKIHLDRNRVPGNLWPLVPYAEFWGVVDDQAREKLVREAPPLVRANLKAVVAEFDNALDQWLAGPEADTPSPSAEYVAFSAMRMAADFA